MPNVTFAISKEAEKEIKELPWINWSEVAREEFELEAERSASLERALEIVSKSKFTEKDADEMGEKVKESMFRERHGDSN